MDCRKDRAESATAQSSELHPDSGQGSSQKGALEQAIAERDEARRALDEVLASRSWRLTRPLRESAHWARNLRHQLNTSEHPPGSLPGTPPATVRQASPRGPVDIIVPVYRGLEETRACLESVWRSTNHTPYRLVVINDASPEPEVTAWLREVSQKRPMLLLENEENLGFVGTVNRGMSLSTTADVVLLNSDAEVANDWLDRLTASVYRPFHYPVGTSTPFSNNATICSYPRFCEDNELPAGHTLVTLDRLFAEANPGERVEIPTAVGFCMYIRRECLDDVGLFDVEHFGKGYGEENDFCMRAIKRGWANVHALDVFAWHKGSVSFGASNQPRMAKALETLLTLHPDYNTRVQTFVAQDPARTARTIATLHRLRNESRPRILFVNHQRGGGTEYHCHELAKELDDSAIFLYLIPKQDGWCQLSLLNPGESLELWFHIPDGMDDLAELLRSIGVSRVHYHHILGLDNAILALPEAIGAQQFMTFHDYFLVCPQVTLTDEQGKYCGEQGVAQCRACLNHRPAPAGEDILSWRQRHAEWLRRSDWLGAPSADTAERIRHYFPDLAITAVAHPGMYRNESASLPTVQSGERLRVAVLGALSKEKGADLLEEVATRCHRNGDAIEFKLFGYAYRQLSTGAGIDVTGPYRQEALPAMLNDWSPHVIWFPARCPETYSYTLSLCLEMGLPVAASRIGALIERLEGRQATWLLDHDTSADQWRGWFKRLQANQVEDSKSPASCVVGRASSHAFYRQEYLATLPAPSPTDPAPDPQRLHVRFPIARLPLSSGLRHRLLALANRLRSHRLFRPLLRCIPTSTQRRVKGWLLGERH